MAEDKLLAMRHSLAHIMAGAIQQLWPKAKFGVGPVVEHGFYYDVDLEQALTPEDLTKIEAKMQQIIKADHRFEKFELGIEEAITKVKREDQDYKVELLKDLQQHGTTSLKDIGAAESGIMNHESSKSADKVTTVSFYRSGDFEDLCRGPHVESTGKVGAFKLTKVSGAYWRGDQANPQMQRVYGVGFMQEAELKEYLQLLEEAEKRDHRVLGQKLDLFMISDLVGAGLPLFTPKGTTIVNAMMEFVRRLNRQGGYEEVRTGHMTRQELYEKSGHASKFGDDLFVVAAGEDKLALKPMNCPHHIQLYQRQLRSYRDLPIKYAEFSTLHRNEVKGALGGLTRVRALTQDDAHAFVRSDQIEAEVQIVIGQIDQVMKAYGLTYRVRLSLRDPANMTAYLGDGQVWDKAEALLEDLAKKFQMDYELAVGEAAFYGPKMDFLATDAIGREWQVSTIQLDFNQPARFGLSYVSEDGKEQLPVMIHRALNGTFERMLGILIEHYAGAFPVWLAPEQVRLATVNDSSQLVRYAEQLQTKLRQAGIRAELDQSKESVGKKIRNAEVMKVPYTLVVGEQELSGGKLKPRVRKDLLDTEVGEVSVEEFITAVSQEISSRAAKSLL